MVVIMLRFIGRSHVYIIVRFIHIQTKFLDEFLCISKVLNTSLISDYELVKKNL